MVETHQLVHVVCLGCKQNNGDIRKFPDFTAGGKPVHIGHHHIQHYQIRLLLLYQTNGFQTVTACDYIVAFILQIKPNSLNQQGFVIHYQYFHGFILLL